MKEEAPFVGRQDYLEAFAGFLTDESATCSHLLIVEGEQGVGKTSLLQAMASQAAEQGHVVILGQLDEQNPEFAEDIYPLIAMLRGTKRLELGRTAPYLQATLIGLAAVGGLVGAASGLGAFLFEIRQAHRERGANSSSLAELFHTELAKVNDRFIGGAQRLVIVLDVFKSTPPAIIHLLRRMADFGLPRKIRLVVVQRPSDRLAASVRTRDLEPYRPRIISLEKMSVTEEMNQFISAYDQKNRLNDTTKPTFLSRYGGWPQLMKLALEELQPMEGEVTEEIIKGLPPDIGKFWEERYQAVKNERSRALVHTVCLLPQAYPQSRLAGFLGLSHAELDAAWADPAIWRLLAVQGDYPDCPWPLHESCREHIAKALAGYPELHREHVVRIAAHYREILGPDLDRAGLDEDALVHLPRFVYLSGYQDKYLREVDRLFKVKLWYGLLESCEADLLRTIEVFETVGSKDGLASAYGNLGTVYLIKGDLDQAEAMYKKSLALNEALGRKEGLANQYGNLGIVYLTRGDLDQAEAMFKKSLALNEALGRKEGLANQYGNLGNVYLTRGDLDQAEAMYKKSLAIEEALGRKEGLANQYGNLGIVYLTRGDLDQAEAMYKKSLALNEALGRKEGLANAYGNLGYLYRTRGNLDQAKDMYKKSLKLFEELGAKTKNELISKLLAELKQQ